MSGHQPTGTAKVSELSPAPEIGTPPDFKGTFKKGAENSTEILYFFQKRMRETLKILMFANIRSINNF